MHRMFDSRIPVEVRGDVAQVGRDVVVDKVLGILGTKATYESHNHHDFALTERRFDTDKGVELRGAAADEVHGASRRLNEVLRPDADTIRILHPLEPIGVAMAGADTFDPYKD
jgi:hypothetical protein